MLWNNWKVYHEICGRLTLLCNLPDYSNKYPSFVPGAWFEGPLWKSLNISSASTMFNALCLILKTQLLLFIESVRFSRSVVSDSLRPHESQHARLPCPSPTPGVHSNLCALNRWYHPAISSSVIPFPLAPNPSRHQGLFQWVNSSHEVTRVLEFQPQHQSFLWIFRIEFL